MYLKRIELQGFKSFAGKTVLEFHKGITSLVGPNGSGKSNIADAVRWVLGEQSAKQLRGSKMLDVIFSGTQYRKAVGFAEVTLVIDNTEGKLQIDYTEVAINRRLYRSGESDFSINGNSCRLKDIRELFLDTGIGRDGYSIISQGKIQEILSVKSEERRGIFEEAAGIMKYKVKKLEAQRKLERTEQNLLRIGDIVHELSIQLVPLEEQSKKAKEYLKIREILQKYEVGLYLNNLKNYNSRLEKYDLDIETLKGDIENQNTALDKAAVENANSNKRLYELDELEEKARKNLNDYIMSVETTRHEIQIFKERLKTIEYNRERAKKEIVEIDEKRKQLSRDYYKREKRIIYLEKQKTEFKSKLDERRNEMDKIMASLGEKEKEIECLKETIYDKSDILSDLKIKIRTRELDNISLDESITATYKNLQSIILEKDAHLLKMQDAKRVLLKISAHIGEESTVLDSIREKIQKSKDELEALKDTAGKKRTRLGIVKNNMTILDDMEKRMEGYETSVKAIMEETESPDAELKGISGIIARLIDVKPGYEKAVETALGTTLQSIVMENDEDIERAIVYLKEQNRGKAAFLSLSSTGMEQQTYDVMEKARLCEGYRGIATEFIKCDIKFREVVFVLLENTVVVDNYANAYDMRRITGNALEIVSLEGDYFGKSGIISGGSHSSGLSGILNREKRIKTLNDEIGSLKTDITEIYEKTEKHIKDQNELKKNADRIEESTTENNIELIRLKTEITASEGILSRLQDRIVSSESLKKNYQDKKSKNTGEMEIFRTELVQLETYIGGLKIRISEFELSHQDERQLRDALHIDISNLKVSYNSVVESLESTSELIDRIDFEKKELDAKKELTVIEIDEFGEKEEQLKIRTTEKEKLVANPEMEKGRLGDVLNALTGERREIEEGTNRHIETVNSLNKEILLLQNKSSKIEVSKAKTLTEIDAMKSRMWDEYGMTHNEALGKHSEIENVTEARKEISSCRRRLKELGSVNVNAIEDFAKTNERYRFLSVQQEDLDASKEDLYKVIKEMNAIMRKTFVQKLKIINERFDKIFKELFEGGKARIEICDENNVLDSGIDIIVQPPGKRLQNMMLLSGGEKAFTAIALVFAILEINPSPFCIFDEIESTLDETNVWKFGEYIRKYKNNTQFIMITHRKGTMEHSDSIYGVTMQEHGVSTVVSMKMID